MNSLLWLLNNIRLLSAAFLYNSTLEIFHLPLFTSNLFFCNATFPLHILFSFQNDELNKFFMQNFFFFVVMEILIRVFCIFEMKKLSIMYFKAPKIHTNLLISMFVFVIRLQNIWTRTLWKFKWTFTFHWKLNSAFESFYCFASSLFNIIFSMTIIHSFNDN